jgi:hypothetical protein
MRKIKSKVSFPIMIRTISYKAWQYLNFPIPKALNQVIMEILKNRINRKILEPCHKPYRNLWFIIKKKNRKYRFVNYTAELNKYIIRDANMFPNINTFLKEFVGYVIASFIDFFSGYDHVKLDFKCKNMTVFIIPLGLFRQTIIL